MKRGEVERDGSEYVVTDRSTCGTIPTRPYLHFVTAESPYLQTLRDPYL